MKFSISPTPLTAAVAGAFSALLMPALWKTLGTDANSTGGIGLVIAFLLVVALPAHAFVLGFNHRQAAGSRGVDTELLKRVVAWLGAAIATVLLTSGIRF